MDRRVDEKWICPSQTVREGQHFKVSTEIRVSLVNKDRHRRTNAIVTVRCHPNYQNAGKWFDWVTVDYENEQTGRGEPTTVAVPCKVLAFVFDDRSGRTGDTSSWKAVVHPCRFQEPDDVKKSGIFFQQWQLYFSTNRHKGRDLCHPILDVVQLDSIIDRCFVVEQMPGLKVTVDPNDPKDSFPNKNTFRKVVYILPRRLWGDHFV